METFDFQILKITSLQLLTILIGITLLTLFKFSYLVLLCYCFEKEISCLKRTFKVSKNVLFNRGVASPQSCRPGPANFWFDNSTACNKLLCVVRAQRLGEVSAYQSCVQFSGYVENESQPGLQLVEKLATPLVNQMQWSNLNLKTTQEAKLLESKAK